MIWVNSWYDPGKEREAALTLISQGADVVTHHTDSTAVVQAAEEKGKWSFGYHSDMSKYGPKTQLSATTHQWGDFYTKQVQAMLGHGAVTRPVPSGGRGPAEEATLVPLDPGPQPGTWVAQGGGAPQKYCGNRDMPAACNWMLSADDPNPLCVACRLNRPIQQLIERAGFVITQIDTHYVKGPRVLSFFYEGRAERA